MRHRVHPVFLRAGEISASNKIKQRRTASEKKPSGVFDFGGKTWGRCVLKGNPHPPQCFPLPGGKIAGGHMGPPLRNYKSLSGERRMGRSQTGPSRSFCHSGAHPHPPRFARHLPPWRGKACGRVRTPAPTANLEASLLFVGAGHWPARRCTRRVQEAAPYSSAPAATCSVNLGAEVERRSREFLLTQGPVAREESRRSLRFCAPEILQSPAGTRPP